MIDLIYKKYLDLLNKKLENLKELKLYYYNKIPIKLIKNLM